MTTEDVLLQILHFVQNDNVTLFRMTMCRASDTCCPGDPDRGNRNLPPSHHPLLCVYCRQIATNPD